MRAVHCDTLIDPACHALSHVAGSVTAAVATGAVGGLASSVISGVRWIVENTATWWIRIPSPDLASEPSIARIQAWLLPVTAAVAVGGVIAAGARMAITRRASPLLDVSGGLLTIAAAATLGAVIPALLLKAGDAWSNWILQVSTGGQFAQRLTLLLNLGHGAAALIVVIFGVLAIVLSLVQAVLMLFRQAALVILAGVLPLAAAGSVAPMTRAWIRKVSSWMLALIFYKPAAAAVYAGAFTMIGSGGGPRVALMGFVMLLLSVVMLPALMKFFTWTTGAIGGQGGGGQLLGAAAVGAVAVGSMRSSASGGSAAQGQASYLSTRLASPADAAAPGSSGAPSASGAGSAAPGSRPAATASTAADPAASTPAGTGSTAAGAGAGGTAPGFTGAATAAWGPAAAAAAAGAVAGAGGLTAGAMEPEEPQ